MTGVLGAVVSSWTTCVAIVERLPTLSSATHLIVVAPSAVTSNEAEAALTVVAVPLTFGFVPSVVYTIWLTPDSPVSPAAAIAIETGALVYQPAEQAAVLQAIEPVGAEESTCAVKLKPEALSSPALFCAVTEPACVAAEPVKVGT